MRESRYPTDGHVRMFRQVVEEELRVLSMDEQYQRNKNGSRPVESDIRINQADVQATQTMTIPPPPTPDVPPKRVKPCFKMLNKGECSWGEKCTYSHDPEVLKKGKEDLQKRKD